MRRFAMLLAILLAAHTAPAAAQTTRPAPEADQAIVVEGQRRIEPKQAERFVREVVSLNDGQLARFIDPVCPLFLGVPATKATALTDRLKRVAAAAGVPVATGACEPNLLAAIAGDADTFIATMRKQHGTFFDDLSDVDLQDAFRTGSVHAWRLIETRNEDGAAGVPVERRSSSMFSAPTRAATVNAVVVLSKQIVLDKTIAQLADYVAMRALVGARPPQQGTTASSSILSLFDAASAPPPELTAMDRGLLSGLYAITGDGDAIRQMHQVSREMARPATPRGRPSATP